MKKGRHWVAALVYRRCKYACQSGLLFDFEHRNCTPRTVGLLIE
ncbi:hypothetical protein [Paraburkholderia lacunae]|nr:hypothetical protein [Paraburkholderia lacunae]